MTAADFSNLHLQYKAEQAEGEVPAVIEHDFPGGRMVDHYFVTPSPAFWADEGVQSLDGVSGILFCSSRTAHRGRSSSMSRA